MRDIWNTDPKTHRPTMKITSDFGDVIKEDLWWRCEEKWEINGDSRMTGIETRSIKS